ncbi:MAG TPA: hypothetical protein VFX70_20175 [Mycobacteriales bacterium]|nr:hypothetical protein [Mycobacteriales bacterium]
MGDSRELRRLRRFYLGRAGSGDLRLGFVIDGRDYTNPDQVRTDVATATGALHRRRLAAQMVTEPVDPRSPRSPRGRAPTWPAWAAARTTAAGPTGQPDGEPHG